MLLIWCNLYNSMFYINPTQYIDNQYMYHSENEFIIFFGQAALASTVS